MSEALRTALPGELEQAVAERLDAAARAGVGERIWARDATLWGEPGTPEIADRLGWLDSPEAMRGAPAEIEALRSECAADGITDVVLLGMGGSSLAPEVFRVSFDRRPGGLELRVLDSTHPDAVLAVEHAIDVERTLFLVSTKSGATIETLSLFRHFHARVSERRGGDAGSAFVAITDPGSSLVELAEAHGFRRTFLNDPDIGGRYSALSYFGLAPAGLSGVDVEAVLERARGAADASRVGGQAGHALWLGAALGELASRGRDKLTLVLDEPIEALGLWIEQLIAESTGKHGRGILPIAGEPLGDPGSYGSDRVFVAHGGDPAVLDALAAAGHPAIELAYDGVDDLGRLFFVWELATAVAAWALEINPFDQPNVQEAKDATAAVLERHGERGTLEDVPAADDPALSALAERLEPPAYLALMGYLEPTTGVDRAVAALRAAIRDAHGVATSFGYGPGFLHSTGQLHKGGPATGSFVQLLTTPHEDVEIPEAGYSFATLHRAQADGDLETLRSHGLPAERVVLEGDPAAAIERLVERLGRDREP